MFNKNEFKAQLVRQDMTMKELAMFLGIDESTLYRKIQDDGRFTRQEINAMIERLEIENPQEIFFAS